MKDKIEKLEHDLAFIKVLCNYLEGLKDEEAKAPYVKIIIQLVLLFAKHGLSPALKQLEELKKEYESKGDQLASSADGTASVQS